MYQRLSASMFPSLWNLLVHFHSSLIPFPWSRLVELRAHSFAASQHVIDASSECRFSLLFACVDFAALPNGQPRVAICFFPITYNLWLSLSRDIN
jgi:hypothetical protein